VKGKYKPGAIIESWQDFIQLVVDRKEFFFHDNLIKPEQVLNWQLATVLRSCEKKDGTLRYSAER
jgi:hypothetical protein